MANLNRGEYGGSRILQSGSYDVLWKAHTRVNETASAGLSWLIREHKGHRAAVHAGRGSGLRIDADTAARAFDESHLNTLGYLLLSLEKVREAKEIFRLNIEMYPDSSNVYDSYGQACTISGDRQDAIVNYKKSLDLDPGNQNAVEKLKMLRKQ